MAKVTRDHLYGYDNGEKILLHDVTKRVCTCGYYEVEIPRMELLHEVIGRALRAPDAVRTGLAFVFARGAQGVRDGTWIVRDR